MFAECPDFFFFIAIMIKGNKKNSPEPSSCASTKTSNAVFILQWKSAVHIRYFLKGERSMFTKSDQFSSSFFFLTLSDSQLWSDQKLPGVGGNIHYPDGHTVSHRGEKSHHWTVQLRPRDDTWSQVKEHAKITDKNLNSRGVGILNTNTCCRLISATILKWYVVKLKYFMCAAVIGSTPGWVRWLLIMKTLWRRWWRSLFPMER